MAYYTELPDGVDHLAPLARTWSSPLMQALLSRLARRDLFDENENIIGSEAYYADRVSSDFPTELEYAGIPLIPGLTMVTAATGVGKTQFAVSLLDSMKEQLTTAFIGFQEPDMLVESFNTLDDLADALFEVELPRLIVIDSFRLLQFSIGGTTRAGGVSSGLFSFLTELNNAAMRANTMIIGLFNPLSVDEAIAERYEQEITSSVSQTVKLTGPNQGIFVSRHLDRRPRSFALGSTPTLQTKDSSVAIDATPTPSPFNLTHRIFGA